MCRKISNNIVPIGVNGYGKPNHKTGLPVRKSEIQKPAPVVRHQRFFRNTCFYYKIR